jgi:hypothetical protein
MSDGTTHLPDWWDSARPSDYTHVLGPRGFHAPTVHCRVRPDGFGQRLLLVGGVVRQLCPYRHDGSDANVVEPTPPAPTVHVDDWPMESLLRARSEIDVWARERGLLVTDQRLVVEVRALPRGGTAPGVGPQSAIVVHHDGNDWTDLPR